MYTERNEHPPDYDDPTVADALRMMGYGVHETEWAEGYDLDGRADAAWSEMPAEQMWAVLCSDAGPAGCEYRRELTLAAVAVARLAQHPQARQSWVRTVLGLAELWGRGELGIDAENVQAAAETLHEATSGDGSDACWVYGAACAAADCAFAPVAGKAEPQGLSDPGLIYCVRESLGTGADERTAETLRSYFPRWPTGWEYRARAAAEQGVLFAA
jgi:hypothetical protein